jgi:hypothetical protein
MDDAKKYWRDMVIDILKWGGAIFVLFAGWAASGHYSIFKIREGSRDQKVAGIALLVISFAYAYLLPASLNYIYKHRLKHVKDETLLGHKFVMVCACTISFLVLFVAISMVFV